MVASSQGDATAQLIRHLRDRCSSLGARAVDLGAVSTGLSDLDAVLPHGGLDRGAVHEWLGIAENQPVEPDFTSSHAAPSPVSPARPSRSRPRHNAPLPLAILLWLATRAAASDPTGQGHLVWVGPAVWPYPPALVQAGPSLLNRSLFVAARSPADRLWATDVALRSRAACVVIADATGLDLASTRRLQLAAEAGGGLCLLARPPHESVELSASSTRWLVRWSPSPAASRRWSVELLRCKGQRQPSRVREHVRSLPTFSHVVHDEQAPRAHARGPDAIWILERDHETRHLRVVPDLLGGSGVEETPAPPVRLVG